MEIITELVQNQLILILPVGLVILGCILLFTYSIRPVQQPKFHLSSLDDRKTAGKRKKLKEKKFTSNGYIATDVPKVEKSPTKELKKSPEPPKKEKKIESVVKEAKKVEALKKSDSQDQKKKSNKRSVEKPADFDDGNWETVPSKADKKKKVEQPPVKKEKKIKVLSEALTTSKEEIPHKEETPKVEEFEIEPEAEPERIIIEDPIFIEETALVVEDKKDKTKKKQKPTKVPEPAEEAVDPTGSQPVISAVIEETKITKRSSPSSSAPSGAAFDELGDRRSHLY